jgi:hypothetical protein
MAVAASLSATEIKKIVNSSELMIKHFGYQDFVADVTRQPSLV